MLGLAPVLRVAVGDTVAVVLEEGVVVGVPVGVRVLAGVCVAVGVCVGVPVEDSDTLAVALGLAPGERVAVGDADTVELAEGVAVGVCVGVPVEDNDLLAVMLGLAPRVSVAVAEPEPLQEGLERGTQARRAESHRPKLMQRGCTVRGVQKAPCKTLLEEKFAGSQWAPAPPPLLFTPHRLVATSKAPKPPELLEEEEKEV